VTCLESFVNSRLCLVVAAVGAAAACAPAHSESSNVDKVSRGVVGTTEVTYYDVRGRTPGDVARSIQEAGPEANGSFGHPRASYSSTWHARNDGSGRCDLTSVQVTMVSQMRLPRWTPPADTLPGVAAEWQRFTVALQRHEAEHKNISGRGARQILDGLLALKTFCSEVPRDVKRLTDSIVVQTEDRQAAYDLKTHSGGTQGAVFLARLP
jgi:predicted secreted Zn-dependent protease